MAMAYGDILQEKLETGRTKRMEERKRFIERNMTSAGGYTRNFVESIGVGWPLIKGWKHDWINNDDNHKHTTTSYLPLLPNDS